MKAEYDNRTGHNTKRTWMFCILFMLAGIGIFIGGCFGLSSEMSFVKRADVVSGRITNITCDTSSEGNTNYTVSVEYEYNGENYSSNLSEYVATMKKGAEIKLYVDPQNPLRVQYTKMSYFTTILIIIIGAVVFCFGLFSVIGVIKQSKNMKIGFFV